MVRVLSMDQESRRLLVEGAKVFGIDLDKNGVEAFDLYLRELLKWNRKINLTAIRTEKGIVLKHFLDSLSVHRYVSGLSTLLDLGSGAGFPGIPLKMANPDMEVTLIDSVQKKVDFQNHIIRTLQLRGIDAIHGRVQNREMIKRLEERFDVVVCRAFSELSTLLNLSQLLLKKGGKVLAMKGQRKEEEIRHFSKAERTSYRLQKVTSFFLPFTSFERTILIFEKE
jgi:16S rRNA (guanine527-N7)-methyltransferase